MKSNLEQNLNKVQTSFPSEILGTKSNQDHCGFKEPGERQLHSEDNSVAGEKSICMAIASAQLSAADKSIFHDLDQVPDLRFSQSVTSIDVLLSCQHESCMVDFSEGVGEGQGNNLERMEKNTMCYLDPRKPEDSSNVDKTQSSDQAVMITEPLLCFPQVQSSQAADEIGNLCMSKDHHCNRMAYEDKKQAVQVQEWNYHIMVQKNNEGACLSRHYSEQELDLYEEVKVEEHVDPLLLAKDYSSQLCESGLDPSSPVMQIQSEVSICVRTESITTKSPSLLEVLILHTRQSHHDHITINKMLTPVWKMIATHRFAGPFMSPVKDREAPGYKEIVKRPMDLTTIKRGLSKGRITTKAEFQRDILLMLQNCVMYNSIHHCVHHKALEMQRDVMELLQVLNLQSDKGS